jgi:hypothetical protein
MKNEIWLAIGYFLYFPLIWWAGNALCRRVFSLATVEISPQGGPEETHALKAGRYIGLFERLLISLGVIVHQWEIIVAVVALKTVARYQELDNRITAEYFLVGSLVSLLWAIVVTIALLFFDTELGIGFFRPLSGAGEESAIL